ncbi:hypothetical protein [Acidisphaera sp. L21]|uniref:hypothetical protein n=1 Tax=Acidisphaera sp. L21 TaxID=1641851 RepID=UPI00131D40BD|nr:hypothetical protein [Acidisphaera sp. L21]
MALTRSAASLLSVLVLVGGCTLIDQRTFNPHAGERPKIAQPAQAVAPALVTVDYGTPDPQYAGALHQAVTDAVARKPDVQFDVVTVVPAIGTPANQVAAATGITANAREIARAISADGVDDDRIHLEARAVSGATSRQVQVFVH